MKPIALPQGFLSLDRGNVFLGVLPKRVVIALVNSAAFHGYVKKRVQLSPLHCNPSCFICKWGNRKPIQVKFETNGDVEYIRGYETYHPSDRPGGSRWVAFYFS